MLSDFWIFPFLTILNICTESMIVCKIFFFFWTIYLGLVVPVVDSVSKDVNIIMMLDLYCHPAFKTVV